MRKKENALKIIISVMILLLIVMIIIGFTMQNSSESALLSERVRLLFCSILEKMGMGADDIAKQWWNEYKMFRRAAYIVEYFALGVSLDLFLMNIIKNIAHLPVDFILCFLLSIGDQCLKLLNPGREFDPVDLKFAFIGYLCATLLMGLICFIKQSCMRKLK